MRYALFCFEAYYPSGGWNDLRELTDDLDDAKAKASEFVGDDEQRFAHVVDLTTGEVAFDPDDEPE